MRRVVVLAALALLVGCGSEGDSITAGGRVIGPNVTVYSSLPDPARGVSRDLVDAQKLALLQAGGRAGELGVNFVSVDEGPAAADAPARVAANAAEDVIRDSQVIAVIGGLRSHAARTSIPLFNAAGILHVSPGAGYAGFTEPVAPGEPDRWYPAGTPTFSRLIGDDLVQAEALLAAARRAGGARVAVEAEAGPEAEGLVAALARADAADDRVRLTADPARAGAVIYAGTDPESAAGVAAALAGENPAAAIVLPDELTRAGVAERLAPAARRRAVLVSSAPAPGSTAELRAFEAGFEAEFGRRPGRYAAIAWLGMRRVLEAVEAAGPRGSLRSAVIEAYRALPAPPRQRFTSFRARSSGA